MPAELHTDKLDVNRIRYKSLVQQAEASLSQDGQSLDEDQRAELLRPLHELEQSKGFWTHQQPGLAVFRSPGLMKYRMLGEAPPELAIVADSFHVKPLLRIAGKYQRFRLLAISMDQVQLYEGDNAALVELELDPEVPTNMAEALGGSSHVEKTKRSMFEPEDSDQRGNQLRRYFRRVCDGLSKHHRSDLPLVLAALREYHGIFRDACNQMPLSDMALKRDPFKGVSTRELHKLVMEEVRPSMLDQLEAMRSRYGEAASHGQGSDHVDDIAKAVAQGRVETLMLKQDHRVGGSLDEATGDITYRTIEDPHTDDVLDDLAELTLRRGGRVLVLEADRMPTDTGVAAVMRYAQQG
jgi:hypothetical protein